MTFYFLVIVLLDTPLLFLSDDLF